MDIQFVSTINKDYIPGAIKFLKSLKKYNPNFNYPYNLLIVDELSQSNRDTLTNIYPNIVFKNIKSKDYEYNSLKNKWRVWNYNCFNRFDIFLIECDKLIFFDLDMICLSSLDKLIDIDCEFGGVEIPHSNILNDINKKYFGGGLMVVSRKYLNENTRLDLINLSKAQNWDSDEPVLNSYFKDVCWLPKKYNVLSLEFNRFKKEDISILHFVGSNKPWMSDKLKDNFDDYIIKSQDSLSILHMQSIFNLT